MKKFFKALLCVLTIMLCISLDAQAQSFTRKGNSFEQITAKTEASKATKTDFTWVDLKGNIYPIYITATGRCFVNKVSSKTGKEYKQYLPEEVSRTVCKELNITYQEKKK